MNEERKRILEMVADGTITPSEGARLLEALGSSGFTRERKSSTRRRSFAEATAVLSEIGPMIQETMGDIFRGVRKSDPMEGIVFQELDDYSGEVSDGTAIVIQGTMKKGASLSVVLKGTRDGILKARVDGGKVGFAEKGGKTLLSWSEGEMVVDVPDTAGSAKVVTKGGPISCQDVAVPVTLHTMGGGIAVVRPGNSFSAKTMGGKLEIAVDGSWKTDSKAKSMGGGVSVKLAKGTPVVIDASTLGGSIEPGKAEHRVLSSSGGNRGGSKMSIAYGEDADAPRLSLSTMGGDIVIDGETDE